MDVLFNLKRCWLEDIFVSVGKPYFPKANVLYS